MKKALITGITGQDGSFLAEFLIEKGYEVHGVLRRSSSFNTGRIEHLYLDEWVRDMKRRRLVNLHWGDMTDSSSLIRLIIEIKPDEIYNLAAQSHVKVSFEVPEFTAEADALGVLRLLEAVRIAGLTDSCRIYQASTSELYGMVQEVPQKETTPFYPRSPYGVAKLYGYWIMKNYRESYGMYCCNGILFNHESERRGETFVTRKVTLAAARIARGLQDKLYLGNMNALRDWGYAGDYVECMWLILQQERPDDYVIATGENHSVREFCTLAFREAGIELRWEGEGVHEKGICIKDNRAQVLGAAGQASSQASGNGTGLDTAGQAGSQANGNGTGLDTAGQAGLQASGNGTGLDTAKRAGSQTAGCALGNGTGLDAAAGRANAQAAGLPGSSLEGRTLVEVDPKYFRPAEVDQLLGDPSKARKALGWNPRKTSFEELVKIMVKHDLEEVGK